MHVAGYGSVWRSDQKKVFVRAANTVTGGPHRVRVAGLVFVDPKPPVPF
jgi:hypothetical protein